MNPFRKLWINIKIQLARIEVCIRLAFRWMLITMAILILNIPGFVLGLVLGGMI